MLFFALFMLAFVMLLTLTAFISLYLGVPFAPSNRNAIQAMVDVVKLKKSDLVYELGSGDGCLAFALHQRYGCAVVGFELAPLIFLWSLIFKYLKGMSKVTFLMRNFLKEDLSGAQFLYCYLTPEMLDKVAEKIEKDGVHVTVISHSFAIHRWEPFEIIEKDSFLKTPAVYLYKT